MYILQWKYREANMYLPSLSAHLFCQVWVIWPVFKAYDTHWVLESLLINQHASSLSLSEDIVSSQYHTQFAFTTSRSSSSICYYPSCSSAPCSWWVIGCIVLLCCALTCLKPEQELKSHYSFPVNSFPVRLQSRPGSHIDQSRTIGKWRIRRETWKEGTVKVIQWFVAQLLAACCVMGTAEV